MAGHRTPLLVDWKSECAALIPCFNEAAAVGAVVSAVYAQLPSVLVVDDGSTDATAETARAAHAEVIRHATNRGKGAALRLGFQHLRDGGFRWALTLDGDGQHAPADIPRFFAAAETTQAQLIIGNRMPQAHRMPLLRRQVNRWMTRRLARRAGVPLADSQCGFRLVNLDVLGDVSLRTDHFEIESELLLAFLRAGKHVEFVPVETIYRPGGSKVHPLLDTVRWLRWWLANRRPPQG